MSALPTPSVVANPGRTAAAGAAKAVGGLMVVPMFPADRPDKATDFNDLYQLAGGGLDAVKSCFAGAIDSILGCAGDTEAGGQIDTKSTQVGTQVKATMIEPDPVQAVDTVQDATGHTEATVTPAPTEGSEAPALPASLFPAMDGRPRYVVLDDWTKSVDGNHRPGVYYCGLTAGKTNSPPEPFDAWICSPMHIDGWPAGCRNARPARYGRSFGRGAILSVEPVKPVLRRRRPRGFEHCPDYWACGVGAGPVGCAERAKT